MSLLVVALLLCPAPADAGSGPWVLGQGDHTLYLGLEAQRFDHLALAAGSGADDVTQVGGGVSTWGAKAIATVGLLPRLEAELALPWYEVRQNREEASPCPELSLGACETTRGIGVIRARAKLRALDEILGPPVTLSFGLEAQLGQATADDRARITNLGEGTLDAGAFGVVGRSGSLGGGGGYWSSYLELGGRYRSRNAELGGIEAPGAETWGEGQFLLAPGGRLAFGPEASFLWRPAGVDVEDMLADPEIVLDIDRFSALRIFTAQAGGKVLVRCSDRVTANAGVLHTLYAINNPTDVWVLDLGISARGFLRGKASRDEG